jgi:16S rRNA (guanine527-N7)-methyltransferase
LNELDKHFSELSIDQLNKFNSFIELHRFWNSKVNLISRKDIDNLYVNHILHSLSIGRNQTGGRNRKNTNKKI